MAATWPFFRATLDNMEMVLAKSILDRIAARYASLVEDRELSATLFGRIPRRLASGPRRTGSWRLRSITASETPRSIRRFVCDCRTLNRSICCKSSLFQGYRSGETRPRVKEGIHLSINAPPPRFAQQWDKQPALILRARHAATLQKTMPPPSAGVACAATVYHHRERFSDGKTTARASTSRSRNRCGSCKRGSVDVDRLLLRAFSRSTIIASRLAFPSAYGNRIDHPISTNCLGQRQPRSPKCAMFVDAPASDRSCWTEDMWRRGDDIRNHTALFQFF